jgi:hypothetical protein
VSDRRWPDPPPAQESLDRLKALQLSVRRQDEAMEALVIAMPAGLTLEEMEAVARRFARLVTDSGPRRGLCRFERAYDS